MSLYDMSMCWQESPDAQTQLAACEHEPSAVAAQALSDLQQARECAPLPCAAAAELNWSECVLLLHKRRTS